MAMKRSTRNILLGIGVVVVVGGIAYMAKGETKKVSSGGASGSGPGQPGRLPKEKPPARVAIWDAAMQEKAATVMADYYVRSGEPPSDPTLWFEMVRTTANELFPNRTWPVSPDEEAKFLSSDNKNTEIWQDLYGIARDLTGYSGAGIS